MRKTAFALLIVGVLATAFVSSSLIGNMFPDITGETLSDSKKTLPADAKGKFTLLAMAYSSDSEHDLNTWLSPVYNKFVAKTEMFDSEYDINLYFIPMFSGTNIGLANTIKKRMKGEVDKDLLPYVLFYKGEISGYRKSLAMEEKDTPYIFLLDGEGKIVYATSGQFSEKKMEQIEEKIE